MHSPVVSVIIPVYKAENYLSRCLDSFLAQTFANFEVVLVDDGSPDRSGEMCESYASSDARFKVIHKKNGGVSSARQLGLETAKGKYIIHADPDDWVEPTMLEEMISMAESTEADMVICDYYENTKNSQKYICQKPSKLDHETVLSELLSHNLHGSCCNKLVRRSCFAQYGVTFPVDIIRWEDLWVNCCLMMHPLKISYINRAFYHYDQCVNADSIVRKVTKKGVESQILFCNRLVALLEERGYDSMAMMYQSIINTKYLLLFSGLYTNDEVRSFFSSINSQFIERNARFSLSNIYGYLLTTLLRERDFLCFLLKTSFRIKCKIITKFFML